MTRDSSRLPILARLGHAGDFSTPMDAVRAWEIEIVFAVTYPETYDVRNALSMSSMLSNSASLGRPSMWLR